MDGHDAAWRVDVVGPQPREPADGPCARAVALPQRPRPPGAVELGAHEDRSGLAGGARPSRDPAGRSRRWRCSPPPRRSRGGDGGRGHVPPRCARSAPRASLPRATVEKAGFISPPITMRWKSGRRRLSTLMTSAPHSPRTRPASGAATPQPTSRTRRPASGRPTDGRRARRRRAGRPASAPAGGGRAPERDAARRRRCRARQHLAGRPTDARRRRTCGRADDVLVGQHLGRREHRGDPDTDGVGVGRDLFTGARANMAGSRLMISPRSSGPSMAPSHAGPVHSGGEPIQAMRLRHSAGGHREHDAGQTVGAGEQRVEAATHADLVAAAAGSRWAATSRCSGRGPGSTPRRRPARDRRRGLVQGDKAAEGGDDRADVLGVAARCRHRRQLGDTGAVDDPAQALGDGSVAARPAAGPSSP